MPKAINWPLACLDAITKAPVGSEAIALRLGTLYFEHRYWNPGDVVDVRVNHEIQRQAEIIGEMTSCAIQELSDSDLTALPFACQNISDAITFLRETYPEKHQESEINQDTLLSVVYFRYR